MEAGAAAKPATSTRSNLTHAPAFRELHICAQTRVATRLYSPSSGRIEDEADDMPKVRWRSPAFLRLHAQSNTMYASGGIRMRPSAAASLGCRPRRPWVAISRRAIPLRQAPRAEYRKGGEESKEVR